MNSVILLDLRKAFDLIDHDILIQKLRLYKCSDITIDWFTSYIKGRSQCTIYKGKLSDTLPIKTGVPQGSTLGPLLFVHIINYLPMALQDTDTDMYTNDSNLTGSGQKYSTAGREVIISFC